MDVLKFPTSNLLINTFLRSLVIFVGAMFGLGFTAYNSYWITIGHDIVSLSLIYGKA